MMMGAGAARQDMQARLGWGDPALALQQHVFMTPGGWRGRPPLLHRPPPWNFRTIHRGKTGQSGRKLPLRSIIK